ncbi:MAG: L-2-hydroxyglutarate oxidase [Chloroflexi bacterium]|nr:L-2-hydroxyglutarate oxidase [Chloroflexota bacterium]
MHVEYAIVGGGIVGLATGLALLQQGVRSLAILEAEPRVAAHQTGHNSGVIHSGVYYRPGSLKAQLCTAGREALYAFCAEEGIAHERCGKLIVATQASERGQLALLAERATANRLSPVVLAGEQLAEYEPHVAGVAGLWIAETGIVDYNQVAAAYARRLCEAGGELRTGWRLAAVRRQPRQLTLISATEETVTCGHLITCAGLQADRVARLCGVEPGVRVVPFRGEYYELAPEARPLVKALIYPVPNLNFPFLGVHFTRKIGGAIEAGPNAVLAFHREGYTKSRLAARDLFDIFGYAGFWKLARRYWQTGLGEFYRSASRAAFWRALRVLVPAVELAHLQPAGAGVRAQALGPDGQLVDDFSIVSGYRMTHVLNAPSPAATASLSIGQHIAQLAVADR